MDEMLVGLCFRVCLAQLATVAISSNLLATVSGDAVYYFDF